MHTRSLVTILVTIMATLLLAPIAQAASDPSNPTLRSRGATGNYPITIAVSPDGSSAYASNYHDDTVTMFSRETDGDLVSLGTVPTGDVPWHVTVTADGRHAYVTNYTDGSVSQFARDAATGKLTPLAPAAVTTSLDEPTTLVLSPDGANAYVVNEGDSSLTVFARNAATGALTFDINYPVTDVTMALAISPDGANVYVGGCGGTAVMVLDRDATDGSLSGDFTTGYTAIGNPRSFTMSPDGAQLYAANEDAHEVAVYARSTSDGSLGAGPTVSGVPSGASPRSIAITPAGTHAYVAYRAANTIGVFTRSTADGGLTHVRDLATGAKPTSVAVGAGTTLYSADSDDDTVSTFQLGGPTADLELQASGPGVALQGTVVQFAVTVTNREPLITAPGATVTAQLPSGLSLDAGGSTAGCTSTGASVSCPVSTLGAGASARITIAVTAAQPGSVKTPFRVSGAMEDPRGANDSATVTTRIASRCPRGTSAGVTCTPLPDGGLKIVGTAKSDVLVGSRGADIILGGPGNDRIVAGAGNDRVNGQSGNDVVVGGPGHDRLLGGPGADVLVGGAGNDMLVGQSGADRLTGSAGRDSLFGGLGDDALNGVDRASGDRLSGGHGRDRALYDRDDRVRLVELRTLRG